MPAGENNQPSRGSELYKKRGNWLSSGLGMRWIFTTSAMFTIVALGLIIFFLLKESSGFFKEYNETLISYRQSGLEYTELLKERHRAHVEIDHRLTSIRSDWIESMQHKGMTEAEIQVATSAPEIDSLFRGYRRGLSELRAHIDEKIALAIELRKQIVFGQAAKSELESALAEVTGDYEGYRNTLRKFEESANLLFAEAKGFDFGKAHLSKRLEKVRAADQRLHESVEEHYGELARWNPQEPLAKTAAIRAFITGSKWITASDQQNWFGLLPLLSGSLLACGIALIIAVPTGVGAAIYVNQIARPIEQAWIKPYIEFISALPAVVLGFFGVMIFGEFVREISRLDALQWLPFFPIQERLNAFTAGSLLGLMAVPTIFTLTEEALNGVPRHLKEASYAIGATRLQTTWRTIIPSALPGIISAVMLGFGRVIGETMIVLLCAGNRVKIPELDGSLRALYEPIHTMTGMIAQEMGEVVYGGLHYQALFMVGIVLFTLSLIVNYTAQSLAQKHERFERK